MQESREVDQITLQVSRAELLLINNAINEVCNGIHIDSVEFHTRLGVTLEEAQAFLERLGGLFGD